MDDTIIVIIVADNILVKYPRAPYSLDDGTWALYTLYVYQGRYTLSLRLRIAQKPCIVWSLGPKALYVLSP